MHQVCAHGRALLAALSTAMMQLLYLLLPLPLLISKVSGCV